jgi:hypothetical protein
MMHLPEHHEGHRWRVPGISLKGMMLRTVRIAQTHGSEIVTDKININWSFLVYPNGVLI